MNDAQRPLDQALIASSIEGARRLPALGVLSEWWLTFCITGTEAALESVAVALAARGGENLDDADSGFLNAKLRVARGADQIIALVVAVDALAEAAGAELVAVDADTSADVEQSDFVQLWVR